MTTVWPRFEEREWSARFDSYDQYRDNVYYIVTMRRDHRQFVAEVDIAGVGDGADATELGAHVRTGLGRIAATGSTNTAYVPHPSPGLDA